MLFGFWWPFSLLGPTIQSSPQFVLKSLAQGIASSDKFFRLGAQMYGFVAAGFTFASILMFILNLYIVKPVGYQGFLWITAGLNYFSLILLWVFYNPSPKWNWDRMASEVSLKDRERENSNLAMLSQDDQLENSSENQK